MTLFNTQHGYGWLTIVLHWVMALAIFGMFGLGLFMMQLDYYDPWYQTAPNIHRSIGILLLALLGLRLLWRLLNQQPPIEGAGWEQIVAKLVHRLFYFLMAALMLSGYLISTADGQGISVFGWFEVPALISGIANQEDIAGDVHEVLAWGLIMLALLHALAALKHHFIHRDATLKRMLGRADEKQDFTTTH